MKTHRKRPTWTCVVCILAVLVAGVDSFEVKRAGAAQAARPGVIFMHHSTGGGLIGEGSLREAFNALGYDLWDHGYNDEGLTDPAGNRLDTNWAVPGDNTDPDGWYAIFNQPVTDPPTNTLSFMLQYDIIIFKSCFPSSDIGDEARLDEYRNYYLGIRDVMDRYPDKLFIPWTTPPLVPSATTPENAQRARQWAAYLTSDEYLAGRRHIAVFDIFSIWSDDEGYLRQEYRIDEGDSHPNELGNRIAAPLLVQFVDEAWRSFSPGTASAVIGAAPEGVASLLLPTLPALNSSGDVPSGEVIGPIIGDFEQGDFQVVWWGDTVEGDNKFTCAPEPPGFESEHALRISYQLEAGLNAGCGRNLEPGPDWEAAEGLRFMWRSDTPGLRFTVVVTANGMPFEAILQTQGEEWTEVILPWSMFPLAAWADGGTGVFDPASLATFGVSLGDWQKPQQGTLWLDGIQLVMPRDEE